MTPTPAICRRKINYPHNWVIEQVMAHLGVAVLVVRAKLDLRKYT